MCLKAQPKCPITSRLTNIQKEQFYSRNYNKIMKVDSNELLEAA